MDFMEACANYRKAVQQLEQANKSVEQARETLSVMQDRKHKAELDAFSAKQAMEEAAKA